MIDFEITYNLPNVAKDFSEQMPVISEMMLASVQMNLLQGGRPERFKVKPPNETPLVGSGKMAAGLRNISGQNFAEVYMDSSVVSSKGHFYPASLNFGAEIPPVDGKLMVFQINGETIYTTKRKGFHLGPFPFMIFQKQDIDKILNMLGSVVFTESGKVRI